MKRAVIFALFALSSLNALAQEKKNAPPLTLKSLEGRAVRLTKFRGKVVLLNFWATWCPPCRAEMPAFVKYQREYAEQGLQIIGVTYPPQTRAEVRKFAKSIRVNYPIALGSRATKTLFTEDETLPLTVIIDREGVVAGIIAGILLTEEFDAQIKPLLEQRNSEGETRNVRKSKKTRISLRVRADARRHVSFRGH
jgi:thiol-disulfide isomerase/thioredoxin